MSLTMILESTKLLMFIHNHIVILVLTHHMLLMFHFELAVGLNKVRCEVKITS